mmetsp:Transcript_134161/g.304238  ORF Transcript_134161/g.304238 Transcript_134161/m.304238 type:complete len:281 (-) Transcript_134161:171-1013(-)
MRRTCRLASWDEAPLSEASWDWSDDTRSCTPSPRESPVQSPRKCSDKKEGVSSRLISFTSQIKGAAASAWDLVWETPEPSPRPLVERILDPFQAKQRVTRLLERSTEALFDGIVDPVLDRLLDTRGEHEPVTRAQSSPLLPIRRVLSIPVPDAVKSLVSRTLDQAIVQRLRDRLVRSLLATRAERRASMLTTTTMHSDYDGEAVFIEALSELISREPEGMTIEDVTRRFAGVVGAGGRKSGLVDFLTRHPGTFDIFRKGDDKMVRVRQNSRGRGRRAHTV